MTDTDAAIVDQLTAYLNRTPEPSGGDFLHFASDLIAASGRPLLSETPTINTEIVEDRHGIAAAVVTADDYSVRVTHALDGSTEISIMSRADTWPAPLSITVDGRLVLTPAPHAPTAALAELAITPHRRR